VGTLRAVDDRGIVIEAGEADLFIPFDDIAQANYEHEFAAVPSGRL
jgi:ribosome maturation factor RimP